MKMRLGAIGFFLIGCVAAIGCVSTGYHETVSMGTTPPAVSRPGGWDQPFYDDLAPHGRWVFVAGPGWVWSPYHVQADWRPYRLGHWVFTDHGWTWSSDEDWGWVVYHYGRWHLDPSHGWVWAPGTEWGPAWVAWHEGGGYVGWAPLPWQVRFRAGVGLDWAGVSVSIEPSWWSFASARYLIDPGLRAHIVPPARNLTLIQVTQNVTNYTYIDNRIVNAGVKVEKIGRALGRTIPRYRVQPAESREAARGGKVKGSDFIVFRPDPPRGRESRGRIDPPGHDEKERLRHLREVVRPAERPPEPVYEQPSAPLTAEKPDEGREEAQPKPAPPERPSSNPDSKSRGRRILDELIGKEPPRPSPRGGSPSRPPNAAEHPAPPTPAASGPDSPGRSNDRPAAATPPARSEPAAAQPAKDSTVKEKEKPKPGRDASTRGKKPKPENEKPKEHDSDEPKSKKSSSDY